MESCEWQASKYQHLLIVEGDDGEVSSKDRDSGGVLSSVSDMASRSRRLQSKQKDD